MRAAATALVALLVVGCDRDNGQHTNDEITQLQAEFEQLANQVGRLEFRIYELENQHSTQSPADGTVESDAPASGAKVTSPEKPAANRGRFDLTPVEP